LLKTHRFIPFAQLAPHDDDHAPGQAPDQFEIGDSTEYQQSHRLE